MISESANLSAGIEHALDDIIATCKRDGFQLKRARLIIQDTLSGELRTVDYFDEHWHELISLKG
jgi:hypothetical protein